MHKTCILHYEAYLCHVDTLNTLPLASAIYKMYQASPTVGCITFKSCLVSVLFGIMYFYGYNRCKK